MTNYGTLIDNALHSAPRAFMLHGAMVTNPKAEHFAALNVERAKKGLPLYLPVVDERPSTDAAHHAVATGWTRDGETWRRVYEMREVPPPPPRTFSKYRLVSALMQANVWPQVKAWIERIPGAYDLYLAAEAKRRAEDARRAWEQANLPPDLAALRAAQRLASTTQDVTVIVGP